MSRQLHAPDAIFPGKEPRFQLDRRLGGPQGRSARGGDEKNPNLCRESNPGRSACSLVTVPIKGVYNRR
jgi:hypothetical protein